MRKSSLFLALFSIFVFASLGTVNAQDSEETKGLVFFKIGKSSSTPNSINTNVGFGAGVAFKPFTSRNFYVEPSLLFNWPKKEFLVFEGSPFARASLKTVLVDFNVSQALVVKKYDRFAPYITTGIGFVRNWATATDGYFVYSLSSQTDFTKNLGTGLRVFLGENKTVFVSGEFKNYWSKGGNFHTFSGGLGFRF